jgi:hypothetical protein
LRAAGNLVEIVPEKPVRWVKGENGTSVLTLTLERQAVALIRLHP